MPTSIILDCDPGIDDALAIAFAHGHPGIDLLGITTVAGNVSLARTTANALAVSEYVGAAGTPVTPGCAGPLLRPALDARQVHGESGLGGAVLPAAAAGPAPGHAIDYITETVRGAPGRITLVATGPLTNIALAVRREPRLVDWVREFVIMGGSAGRGNTTPAAEYNIWADPEAAAAVFRAGWTVVVLGLDVTLQTGASPAVLQRMRDLGPLGAELLLPALEQYKSVREPSRGGLGGSSPRAMPSRGGLGGSSPRAMPSRGGLGGASPRASTATESTVLGPFHVVTSPPRALGDTIDLVGSGTPCVVEGRVLSAEGTPLPGAELDVWQASDQGFYDVQQPDVQPRGNGRGLFTADQDGAFWFRTVVPSHYPIPADGPVGALLNATKRHPYRPAHIHVIVTAPGHRALTTHIFVAGSPYIESDAVFAVKKSLITEFTPVDDPEQAARYGLTRPFRKAVFDIVLLPAAEN
jgi:inosine-uridine nucleoside N-ribohydrolase/protocatechuate 3,4-dioxygenase beta subunit